jgi:hypothetical protein
MAVSMKMAVFWVVAPCSLVSVYMVLKPRKQPSSRNVIFDVLTVEKKAVLFLVMMPCRLVDRYQHCGEMYCLCLQG